MEKSIRWGVARVTDLGISDERLNAPSTYIRDLKVLRVAEGVARDCRGMFSEANTDEGGGHARY